MKSSLALLLVVVMMAGLAGGCTAGANPAKGTANGSEVVAGFWLGLWHGFIAPIVFVVSLFKTGLGVYEVHNSGGWYNFGYLFGLACFFGGGGRGSAKQKRE